MLCVILANVEVNLDGLRASTLGLWIWAGVNGSSRVCDCRDAELVHYLDIQSKNSDINKHKLCLDVNFQS